MSELSDLLKRYRKLCRDSAGNSLSQKEVNSQLDYDSDIYGH